MKLVNLTPHELKLLRMDGTALVLSKPAEGTVVPRRSVQTELVEPIQGLPEPEADTIFIVSRIVVDGAPQRLDLYAPGEAVRDGKGAGIGARGLCR